MPQDIEELRTYMETLESRIKELEAKPADVIIPENNFYDVKFYEFLKSQRLGLGQPPDNGATMASTGQYFSKIYALTDGATIALDWNNGNVQSVTLGGNRTFTMANPKNGGRYVIILKQDGTGSRTVTWPAAGFKWAGGTTPTLTTTAGKKDVITIFYDGTDYLANSSLNH